MEMLPANLTVVGIEEKTALVIYPASGICQVLGLGGVTLIHTGQAHQDSPSESDLDGTGLLEVARMRESHVHQFQSGQSFSLGRIGDFHTPDPGSGLPESVWQQALNASIAPPQEPDQPTSQVMELVRERESARQRKDWSEADRIRKEIAALGWQVQDTPEGPRLEQIRPGNH